LEDINILNSKNQKKRNVTYKVILDNKDLPIKKNEKIGKLIAFENGKSLFEVSVYSKNDIKKANIFELYLRNIKSFINGDYFFRG